MCKLHLLAVKTAYHTPLVLFPFQHIHLRDCNLQSLRNPLTTSYKSPACFRTASNSASISLETDVFVTNISRTPPIFLKFFKCLVSQYTPPGFLSPTYKTHPSSSVHPHVTNHLIGIKGAREIPGCTAILYPLTIISSKTKSPCMPCAAYRPLVTTGSSM